MCRETQLEWYLGGADLDDTLVSLQPRTTVKDLGGVVRSPEPPNGLGVVREAANSNNLNRGAEQVVLVSHGRQGAKPVDHPLRAPSSGPPSRLLPYFPKHGVTSPPTPQSLARNADLVTHSAPTSASKATEKAKARPSPLPGSKANGHSILASSKAAARNPSPAPASRTTSRTQLSEKGVKSTATNASPTPAPRTAPRNPSPTPASRATARNPSTTPAPRTPSLNPSPAIASKATARNPSPSPVSRTNNPVVSSTKTSGSPLTPASNGNSVASLRRPASPALTRKEPSRPLYDDNGRRIVTPHSARKSTTVGSSPGSSMDSSGELSPRSALDVNRALRMSINRSLKKEGLGQWSPESVTYSPIKKLTPLELQAQKKERIAGYGRKNGGPKSARVACEGMLDSSPTKPDTRKRCHWVTPQSEPGLISYHDDVWGVPLHDDTLLFELLVLEGLQGELSRPQILSMRDYFRDVFAGFDPAIVAKFGEKKVTALKVDDIIRQPEAKLRGVIENAKQLLKITEEFGSFDKYLWNFVGFKPIVNSYHIFNQIPVKSSKSETLSKDLMRRGFRYVGPTTVYSFMQAAGMVNDHLVSCYRHGECSETSSQLQPKNVNCGNKKGC
ncbi:unnamed protein product [Calypogeia fissa]